MSKKAGLVEVTPANVAESGFFCYMSKRKSEGFRQKFDWVRARFDEGLRIKMLEIGDSTLCPPEGLARPGKKQGLNRPSRSVF